MLSRNLLGVWLPCQTIHAADFITKLPGPYHSLLDKHACAQSGRFQYLPLYDFAEFRVISTCKSALSELKAIWIIASFAHSPVNQLF